MRFREKSHKITSKILLFYKSLIAAVIAADDSILRDDSNLRGSIIKKLLYLVVLVFAIKLKLKKFHTFHQRLP